MHGAEFINSLAIIKCIIKIIAENGKFQRPVSPRSMNLQLGLFCTDQYGFNWK